MTPVGRTTRTDGDGTKSGSLSPAPFSVVSILDVCGGKKHEHMHMENMHADNEDRIAQRDLRGSLSQLE